MTFDDATKAATTYCEINFAIWITVDRAIHAATRAATNAVTNAATVAATRAATYTAVL